MDKLLIIGGNALHGDVNIAGAKNAVLPIMMASVMSSSSITITNIPHLSDVTVTLQLLSKLGVKCHLHYLDKLIINLDPSQIDCLVPDEELVQSMRASIILLGPLLARFGEVKLYQPGGCIIGSRPIDLHIENLRKMGAEITEEGDYITAKAKRLKGVEITFPMVTVTGTENILCAATLAKGTTVIHNAALEPEVGDLALCLNKMGAKISGIGTSCLTIEGVEKLGATDYTVISDRVEAATYLIGGVMTRGKVRTKNITIENLQVVVQVLQQAGAKISSGKDWIEVDMLNKSFKSVDLITQPFPGFPTDVQAQMVAMNTVAEGSSVIEETVFESRFHHVSELKKMGANLSQKGNKVYIKGSQLHGAQTIASDLRASASLVLASLVAEGESIIHRVQHIDRGYELVEEKLECLGASILRFHDNMTIA